VTIHSVTPDALEAIAFDHPGNYIAHHVRNGVDIRELHIGDDVWTARTAAA
jgi:hypothetical protein